MTLRVVCAGTPEFAVPALAALAAAGHTIVAVYTQPDRPAGRGRVASASPVKQAALALGIPVRQSASLKEAAAEIAALAPELIAVAAYGLMLPSAVLALPRLGCVNLHASLLPRWRGAAPIQRALLAGDAATGVCIMRMEAGLDTGPVYACERVAIAARDTAATLATRLAAVGARLLVATIAALESGAAVATPQAAAGVSYARKLEKQEALIDWSACAAELDRRVRAFVPWPVAETRWRGAQLRLHEAEPLAAAVAAAAVDGAAGAPAAPGTILSASSAGIEVATGAGVLRLTRVQPAGRRIVAAHEFANAAGGTLVGARFGA